MLSIIDMAKIMDGYSVSTPDSSFVWNSGNVPNTKVMVEIRTTPSEVKAMTFQIEEKCIRIMFI